MTALGTETITYDVNGNLLTNSTVGVDYKYDANRLRQLLTDPGSGTVVAEDFDYYCENRLRKRERMNGGLPGGQSDGINVFYYDG